MLNTTIKGNSIKNVINILLLHSIFLGLSVTLFKNFGVVYSLPIFAVISLIHVKFVAEYMHEASHYFVHSKPAINDFIGNFLIGVFFLISVKNYRLNHFQHHKFDTYFKKDDPETGLLKVFTKKQFLTTVLLDLIGYNGVMLLLKYSDLNNKSSEAPRKIELLTIVYLLIHLIIFGTSIIFGFYLQYLVFMFVTGSLFHLQLRLRIICQHVYIGDDPNYKIQYEKTTSRAIYGGFFEKLFFTSDITAFHNLHHEISNLSYRQLKEKFLSEPFPSDKNVYSSSRFDVLRSFYKSLA